MLGWLKSLLVGPSTDLSNAGNSEPDDLWNVMERMDPRNSLARLHQLNLSREQLPIVKGLLEGTISPADRPGNSDWCRDQEVNPTGVDALTYALQTALESEGTTYVFPSGQDFPAALIPKFINRNDLSIVVSHTGNTPVIITSLDDFLTSIDVTDFSSEILVPLSLSRRITNKPSFAKDSLDRGSADSVTIEKRADDDQNLLEPFDMSDLATAVSAALGIELTPAALEIKKGPIDQLGLYTCIAQVDSITKKKIHVWVVPKVELEL